MEHSVPLTVYHYSLLQSVDTTRLIFRAEVIVYILNTPDAFSSFVSFGYLYNFWFAYIF